MDNPPLPTEFGDESELRVRLEKWKHLSPERRASYVRNCVAHLIGWKRRMGLLPKKP